LIYSASGYYEKGARDPPSHLALSILSAIIDGWAGYQQIRTLNGTQLEKKKYTAEDLEKYYKEKMWKEGF
jgi:hypothetical protein